MSAEAASGCDSLAPVVCNSAPALVYDESQLEAAIAAAMDRMCAAPEREEKMCEWREMCRLIDMRSIHYVRFMERTRGLA